MRTTFRITHVLRKIRSFFHGSIPVASTHTCHTPVSLSMLNTTNHEGPVCNLTVNITRYLVCYVALLFANNRSILQTHSSLGHRAFVWFKHTWWPQSLVCLYVWCCSFECLHTGYQGMLSIIASSRSLFSFSCFEQKYNRSWWTWPTVNKIICGIERRRFMERY